VLFSDLPHAVYKQYGIRILDMETLESLDTIVAKRKTAWTVEALAQLLSCSGKSLYKMIQSGKLPAYRIGSSIRIDPKAAAVWLKGRSTI
jgi:excisionase family DNA binding protein